MWDFNVQLWEKKYKYKDESTPEDTFRRVANAIGKTKEEKEEFFKLLIEGRFLAGGRILAYAGTDLPLGHPYLVIRDVEDLAKYL
ncbi:MAG TPA: ribonucleotide reductase N-terminal alpha domain-containing protein, partial [Thermodesulfovibrio thiophilus]|nr:ribonucleotide reductase N-terminal alpha domain-containing protein [Thermodesulfovibrio thiophilus]